MAPRTFQNYAEVQPWIVGEYDLGCFRNRRSVLVRWIKGERVRRIWARLAPGASDRVREIGSGVGHLLARVPAGRRFGVDLADVLLQRACGRVEADAALAQGDATELPFASDTSERVYCSKGSRTPAGSGRRAG